MLPLNYVGFRRGYNEKTINRINVCRWRSERGKYHGRCNVQRFAAYRTYGADERIFFKERFHVYKLREYEDRMKPGDDSMLGVCVYGVGRSESLHCWTRRSY